MHRTNMKRKTVFGKNKVPLQGGLAGFVRREVCESTFLPCTPLLTL